MKSIKWKILFKYDNDTNFTEFNVLRYSENEYIKSQRLDIEDNVDLLISMIKIILEDSYE